MIAMISPGNSDVEHTLNTLRYADRVKELGTEADGNGDAKKDYDDEEAEYNRKYDANGNGNYMDDEDLEDEDLYDDEQHSHAMNDLQETLAELQDMEEQVLESHGDLIRDSHKWMTEYEKIYEETIKVVDYDREEYAKRLDSVINNNMQQLLNLQKKLAAFKEGLIKEEKISKAIQPKPRK
jgi:kinesin family protein 2/24